jgi:hypothetical protein
LFYSLLSTPFTTALLQVKIQVIQNLSILIQNIDSETSIFYFLSNNHINDLIVYKFDFSDEEVLAYYISFLKTLSLKLNERTILFLFNERANDFPLYTEAIKFINHSESMVRTAVRTLTLNVFRIDDPPLRRFILDRTAVNLFSELVRYVREQVCRSVLSRFLIYHPGKLLYFFLFFCRSSFFALLSSYFPGIPILSTLAQCLQMNTLVEGASNAMAIKPKLEDLLDQHLDSYFYLQVERVPCSFLVTCSCCSSCSC